MFVLFKTSPKNYALNFIDEKNLSELRLAGDFLLSLKSAMNLLSAKDEDEFLLINVHDLSELMYKKLKNILEQMSCWFKRLCKVCIL